MKIDLAELLHDENNELQIASIISVDNAYYENTDIRHLSDVEVKGNIRLEEDSTYTLRIVLKGEMILPCAISLEDVAYPFAIPIDEIIDPNEGKDDDYLKIIDNTIDIMPIIWQNIVVEIPMRVVSPNLKDVKLEGDGWKLLTEEEKMKELDPRLDKLRDLLDD